MKRLNQQLAYKLMKQQQRKFVKDREKRIRLLKQGKTAFVEPNLNKR